LLAARYRRMQEREDRRAALAAWVQVEMNRDRDKRSTPFSLEDIVDWLGHGFQPTKRAESAAPPSPEDLLQKALAFMQVFGESKVNGTSEEMPPQG
jgi:hypothetical protein